MTEWDVAVVGAGIAGLTAARVAAGQGLRVIAFDELAPGGQLVNIGEVCDYPGLPEKMTGPELAGALLDWAIAAGVEVGYTEVMAVSAGAPLTLTTTDGAATARVVVVATGHSPGRLDLPEAADWVGRGLCECASCDGPLYAGRRVAVVGDDEWAAQEALELAALVEHVTVLVPDVPRWSPARADRLAGLDTVEVWSGATVAGLSGEATLAGIRLDDGADLPVAGLFVYTGRRPRTALLDGAPAERVFVAGDVRPGATPYLVAAAADGLRIGLAAAEAARH